MACAILPGIVATTTAPIPPPKDGISVIKKLIDKLRPEDIPVFRSIAVGQILDALLGQRQRIHAPALETLFQVVKTAYPRLQATAQPLSDPTPFASLHEN